MGISSSPRAGRSCEGWRCRMKKQLLSTNVERAARAAHALLWLRIGEAAFACDGPPCVYRDVVFAKRRGRSLSSGPPNRRDPLARRRFADMLRTTGASPIVRDARCVVILATPIARARKACVFIHVDCAENASRARSRILRSAREKPPRRIRLRTEQIPALRVIDCGTFCSRLTPIYRQSHPAEFHS